MQTLMINVSGMSQNQDNTEEVSLAVEKELFE